MKIKAKEIEIPNNWFEMKKEGTKTQRFMIASFVVAPSWQNAGTLEHLEELGQ